METETKKYQKRMLKIWDKWSPDGNNDTDLEMFIKENHPAAVEIREKVNRYVQDIIRGIKLLNPQKRKDFVEQIVKSSWEYENYNGAEYCRKSCDESILRYLFGIYVGGSHLIYEGYGNESGIVNGYYGNSSFFITPKDLEKEWDKLWEENQEDQYYGSDELKDWMWNQQYFGIKRDLFPDIEQVQEIIPDELREEIENKLKEVNEVLLPLKSKWQVFEKEQEEGGILFEKTWQEIENHELYPDESVKHRYFAEEFWKVYKPQKVVEKLKKEKEEKAYKKDLGNAILDVNENWVVNILFKDNIAAQLEGFASLEKLKNGYYMVWLE